MKRRAANAPVTVRRRPQQSRARQTTEALQEALVRLLVVRDYDAVTIRDITDLAGAGLGSFYEYFANKDDLARVCVHLRTKSLLQALQTVDFVPVSVPLETMACKAIDRLLEAHSEKPCHWRVHYLLERRLSGLEPYTKMYGKFVNQWQRLVGAIADRTCPFPAATAWTCQTIIYGLFAHAHLQGLPAAGTRAIDFDPLGGQSQQALLGYLRLATAPLPR